MKNLFPSNRYHKARGKVKELSEMISEDSELLQTFNVVVDSVDPGLTGHLSQFVEKNEDGKLHQPSWSNITLDSTTWWWLRELLIELKAYREKSCLATNGSEER